MKFFYTADQGLKVFASARDSHPAAGFGLRTPAGAEWVRVFVAATELDAAITVLADLGLGRYVETLTEAGEDDVQAIAVLRHARDVAREHDVPAAGTVLVAYRVRETTTVPDAGRVVIADLVENDLVPADRISVDQDGPRVVLLTDRTDLVHPAAGSVLAATRDGLDNSIDGAAGRVQARLDAVLRQILMARQDGAERPGDRGGQQVDLLGRAVAELARYIGAVEALGEVAELTAKEKS